jgi:hypothetical protein
VPRIPSRPVSADVGSLPPILARMASLIAARVLTGRGRGIDAVCEIEPEASRAEQSGGFDTYAVTDAN